MRTVYWYKDIKEKSERKNIRAKSQGQGISNISMVYGNSESQFWIVRYLAHCILFYNEAIELNVFDSFKSEPVSGVTNWKWLGNY